MLCRSLDKQQGSSQMDRHTLSAWRRQSIRLILPFWSGLDSTHMAGFLPVMLSTKSSLHSCVMSFLSLPNSLDAHFCFTSTFSFWNRDSTFLVPFPLPSAKIPSFAVDLPKIRCIDISIENLPSWNFVQLLNVWPQLRTSLWALGYSYSGKTFAPIRPTPPDEVHSVSFGLHMDDGNSGLAVNPASVLCCLENSMLTFAICEMNSTKYCVHPLFQRSESKYTNIWRVIGETWQILYYRMTLGTHLQILTIKKALNETKQNDLILAKKGSERQVMSRGRHENFAFCVTIAVDSYMVVRFWRNRSYSPERELARVGVHCNHSHSPRLTVASENFVASVHMCPSKQRQIMSNM